MTSHVQALCKYHPIYERILQDANLNPELELHEITDRHQLDCLKIWYELICKDWKHHPLSDKYRWACDDLKIVKDRIRHLDRLIVKTPPVTPQLNLF